MKACLKMMKRQYRRKRSQSKSAESSKAKTWLINGESWRIFIVAGWLAVSSAYVSGLAAIWRDGKLAALISWRNRRQWLSGG